MLIFGSRAVNLITLQSNNGICPSCGTVGSTVISVYSKHVHIFWVPIFPIGKEGVSQCQHCKYTVNDDEMPDDIRRDYFTLSGIKKIPIWQFSGTALISIILIFNIVSNYHNKDRDVDYIIKPMVGDVYKCTAQNDNYSTFKIVKITNDSLYVRQNNFATNKFSGLDQIEKDENYSELIGVMSRQEIKKMYILRKIFEIDRKE